MQFVKSAKEEYGKYLESSNYSASEELRESYNSMGTKFDDYVNYVTEESWIEGFDYAMKLILGGGASA